MSKINPGSNRNEDNDLATTAPGGMVDIPEPTMTEKGKYQCPRCEKIFNSKEDYISHALAHHQMPPLSKDMSIQLLSSVPYEKGFHFFTEPGRYTGVTAISLYEFAGKLGTVPVESVVFHFQRKDYQRWLIEVIGDDKLAGRIDAVAVIEGASGEDLRKALVQAVQENIAELKENA